MKKFKFAKNFWQFFKLGILINTEYRLNFLVDALVQPLVTAGVEIFLWFAIFKGLGADTLNGFPKENYLAYVVWGTFVGRITISWMYEHMMINDVESGSINSCITRPITFYEYYLGQLIGYKFIVTSISCIVPIFIVLYFRLPTHIERIPLTFLFILYYLVFVHTISFCVSCLSFFLNRVSAITVAKNLTIYTLSGELFPLDLLPQKMKSLFLSLPFCNGVYRPVGYLIGRLELDSIISGFYSTTISLILSLLLAYFLWKKGMENYSGTGA